ncbi:BnaC09g08950D [Brassica napus]|uniref:BnaC09g08950D protein n=1 Tax=Brassica napus TaxID=3708 RepID=A0A078GQ32_BRANA|nr:BnaC09g08950D [Brassica napus]
MTIYRRRVSVIGRHYYIILY